MPHDILENVPFLVLSNKIISIQLLVHAASALARENFALAPLFLSMLAILLVA